MEHVDNIGPNGAHGRRKIGQIGLVLSIVAAAALLVFHAPRATRLMLVLPLGVAAAGFLQARERT
jgi:uncharacterized membrane protein (UPF0136 family)